MRPGLLVLIASATMMLCASARPEPWANLAAGDAAYQHKDYKAAFGFYRQALSEAVTGDAARVEAFVVPHLAEMYQKGEGVPADTQLAIAFYRRAVGVLVYPARSSEQATQWLGRAQLQLGRLLISTGQHKDGIASLEQAVQTGYPPAFSELGNAYYSGTGVEKNLATALQLYEQGAQAGDVYILVQLGDMYANGEGTAKDADKSAAYYRRAIVEYPKIAESEPYLYVTLADLYRDGKGVARNEPRALELLTDAAEKGDPTAQSRLARSTTPDVALKWTRTCVDAGDPWMLERLGDLLASRREGLTYWKQAAEFYESRAETDKRAATRLGIMYRLGKAVPQDTTAALYWLLIGAHAGDSEAQEELGNLYADSGTDESNRRMALQWYEAAAKNGSVWLYEQVGDLYARFDQAKAQSYWIMASANYEKDSTPQSHYMLGNLYATGRGVPFDIVKARQLLTAAAEAGVEQANAALGRLDQSILRAADPRHHELCPPVCAGAAASLDIPLGPTAAPALRLPPDGWKLVFDEEFDGSTLDTRKWVDCYWWDDNGCTNRGNRELQWYLPANVSVSQGALSLQALEQTVSVGGEVYNYTSGLISTGSDKWLGQPNFAFRYGYVEVRAKIPEGRGLWPTFWMLPASQQDRPEIDILEAIGQQPNVLHATLHLHRDTPAPQKVAVAIRADDLTNDWHTYAVLWRPDLLVWYLDGTEILRVDDGTKIPHVPMYLLANLAVGGNWPGAPDASTHFPAALLMDYVRVWSAQ